jgi:ABC-type glycerol-3-phosphate transport system substrate-binding protein
MTRLLSRVLLAILAACGVAILAFGPRAKSSTPPERVRVQYWEKWTGYQAEQMKNIVDAFNETVGKEKGIWVDFVSMSQIERKTLTAIAGGVPPDIAGMWDRQVHQFAALDALEPLDEYAAAHGLTRDHYKPVYYDCGTYRGRLYALPSTPWTTALHYNKQMFQEKAAELRAAGLDPNRPPRTIDELDRYAEAIDTWHTIGGRRRIKSAGYLPLEPDWFINLMIYWFGGDHMDPTGTRMLYNSPQMANVYAWVRRYSERLGADAVTEFRSGFGASDSPQNAFISSTVSMVMQGPWMAHYVERLNPAMNRWGVPEEHIRREEHFREQIAIGTPADKVRLLLGDPDSIEPTQQGEIWTWSITTRILSITISNGIVQDKQVTLLPAEHRRQYTQWGAAPFPSAVPGLENVTYAGMDILVIPRGARHKKEAFEFIAFANQQAQMERLCAAHCKNSPLAKVSEEFIRNHPNPYIQVFEDLAASPNARPLPATPAWVEVSDELTQVAQRVALLQAPNEQILAEAQARAQKKLERVLARLRAREGHR